MVNSINASTLEVNKSDWSTTRLVTDALSDSLQQAEVILRVDRQALTANNISYAGAGDMLGYWGFFPTEEGWGRIPAMGWADVLHSAHPDIAVGERVWGMFPFATHLKILAKGVTASGFHDASAHRADYAPVYARFDRATGNPIYDPEREDHDSLLRGLFMTSWLVEDFLEENSTFGANACLITSASSKTSIALGSCVKGRGILRSVGLTSERNLAFCRGLNCYDDVVTYDQYNSLQAAEPVVVVDMAGSAEILSQLHHHYQDSMKYSCRVGATHYEDMGPVDDLPGATPEFFFAPGHIQTRSADIGADQLMAQLGQAYMQFRKDSDNWLSIERHYGSDALEHVYQSVLAGSADPRRGQVVSMWSQP